MRSIRQVATLRGLSERSLERHMLAHAGHLGAFEAASEIVEEVPPTERSPQMLPYDSIPSSRLRRVVLDALETHPDARASVLEAIEREERAA